VHTVHRFAADEVREAFGEVGLTAVHLSYANTLLFPLAMGKRLAEYVFPANGETSDVHPNPPWQDKLFSRFLFAEAGWLRQHSLPFGLTLMAIGKRPENS